MAAKAACHLLCVRTTTGYNQQVSPRRSRKDAGTYLFVREGGKRGDRPTATPVPADDPVHAQLASDSLLMPFDALNAARLRYLRPRLRPEALDPRLAFFLDPNADVADDYREAAQRLLSAEGELRTVLVTSPRNGSGKTLTALNLASAVAEQQRVTVVDLHFARPGVASAFGLKPEAGLVELARRRRMDHRAPLDLVLLADRLAALPLLEPLDAEEAAAVAETSEIGRLLDEVAFGADLLVADGPPVLEDGGIDALWPLIDAVVLVVRPSELGSGAYERALTALEGRTVLGTIVNGAPDPPRNTG